ncbi:unnamed protein product [Brassica rapa]|uniref:Uncharacterized protein n=1 Tax=Brassica campestris TaxID=3711 RepID=A0A8D9GDQ3_BRACM|nr:unnamed protein product [Brassica rapa]
MWSIIWKLLMRMELDGIENIDIGGPAMIRAAAKVYVSVLEYLKRGQNDQQFRRKLALKAFQHVAAYDSAVSEWLWKHTEGPCQYYVDGDSGGGYGGFGSRKPREVHARTGSTQSVSLLPLCHSPPSGKINNLISVLIIVQNFLYLL